MGGTRAVLSGLATPVESCSAGTTRRRLHKEQRLIIRGLGNTLTDITLLYLMFTSYFNLTKYGSLRLIK